MPPRIPVPSQNALAAMAGAMGQKTLTVADSPFNYTGLIAGYETTDAGNTISGVQYAKEENIQCDDYTNKPLLQNDRFNVLWSVQNEIVITAGEVKIFFG